MDAKGEQTAFAYTTYIQETPERVWQGLTDPALMKRYWRHQDGWPQDVPFGPEERLHLRDGARRRRIGRVRHRPGDP